MDPITEKFGDKLLADVIHKIKNNLGGIGGFASLLERDLNSNDPQKKLLKRIQNNIIKLDNFVVDIMSLYRQLDPVCETLNLRMLFTEGWESYWEDKKSSSSLPDPEFSDDKIEIFSDARIVMLLIYHVIRFIDSVGKKFNNINIKSLSDNKISIAIKFDASSQLGDFGKDIINIVNVCQPLEARLSFAIILKLVHWQGGDISINTGKGEQIFFLINLIRGD
jgi:signal transduction histidine kinase